MDASLRTRAEQLAGEIASQAKTVDDLNGLMRLMMKSALERMLNTEMDVHLGRRTLAADAGQALADPPDAAEPGRRRRIPLRRPRDEPIRLTVATAIRERRSTAIWAS